MEEVAALPSPEGVGWRWHTPKGMGRVSSWMGNETQKGRDTYLACQMPRFGSLIKPFVLKILLQMRTGMFLVAVPIRPKLLCGAGDRAMLPCVGSENPHGAGAPRDELPHSPAFGEGLGAAGAPPLVIYLGRSTEPQQLRGSSSTGDAQGCCAVRLCCLKMASQHCCL